MDISEQPEYMEQDDSGSFVMAENSRKEGVIKNNNIDFYSQNKQKQKSKSHPRHNDKNNLINQSHL